MLRDKLDNLAVTSSLHHRSSLPDSTAASSPFHRDSLSQEESNAAVAFSENTCQLDDKTIPAILEPQPCSNNSSKKLWVTSVKKVRTIVRSFKPLSSKSKKQVWSLSSLKVSWQVFEEF